MYTDGTDINTTNALQIAGSNQGTLTISVTINNIAQTGDFRVLYVGTIFKNGSEINSNSGGSSQTQCREVVDTFAISSNSVSVKDYYVVACADNTYNLIINATGVAPITCQIIEKNGVTFTLNNGSTPVFTGLSEGIYKVRILDSCSNSIVITVRVVQNKLPKIRATDLCNGSYGRLYVDGLSFLTIKWYKNGVYTGVTGTTYNFSPYNSVIHDGFYEAVLTYEPNTNDCISNTISYTVDNSKADIPNAGIGQTVTINTNTVSGPVDLFTYLTGNPDNYGDWTEVSDPANGLLLDNYWFASSAPSGTYTFRYTVNGSCSNIDTEDVIIILINGGFCYKQAATGGAVLETKHGITALGRAGADNGNWPMVRKGAWTALESKTKGFVINRVPTTADLVNITGAVEGMMVYDEEADCLKVYTLKDGDASMAWHCMTTKACPD